MNGKCEVFSKTHALRKKAIIGFLFMGIFFSPLFGETEQKNTIAVLKFTGNSATQNELEAITNRFRTALFKTAALRVVERTAMDEILKEQGFQVTGCTDQECAVQIGQILNVQQLLLGSINTVGSILTLNVRMVEVSTGLIVLDMSFDCSACDMGVLMIKAADSLTTIVTGKKPEALVKGTEKDTMTIQKKGDPQITLEDALNRVKAIRIEKFGISVGDLREYSGSENASLLGIIILTIDTASINYRIGIRPGDRIMKIGNTNLTMMRDFEQALKMLQEDGQLCEVKRGIDKGYTVGFRTIQR